jgi:L-rhamnose mutarotase
MEQIAFVMRLLPGNAQEYRRRHDEIWPELVTLLCASGIQDYSIFLDGDGQTLFAVLRRTAGHRMDALPQDPIMRRWWQYMADIMEVEADGAPCVRPLQRVFYLPGDAQDG